MVQQAEIKAQTNRRVRVLMMPLEMLLMVRCLNSEAWRLVLCQWSWDQVNIYTSPGPMRNQTHSGRSASDWMENHITTFPLPLVTKSSRKHPHKPWHWVQKLIHPQSTRRKTFLKFNCMWRLYGEQCKPEFTVKTVKTLKDMQGSAAAAETDTEICTDACT